jgi:hypothetical protein
MNAMIDQAAGRTPFIERSRGMTAHKPVKHRERVEAAGVPDDWQRVRHVSAAPPVSDNA